MAGNTGFNFKYNLAGRTSGILRNVIIADSATITIGDLVKLTSGEVVLAAAGGQAFGVVVGIVDKDGINMDQSKRSVAGTNASWTSSTYTFVAGSDNSSVDYVQAVIDFDPFSVWSAQPDSTIGGDTESDLIGCYTDVVAASDQPDENTAATTQATLFIWGVDPEDTTRGLYSIAEHQLWQAS